MAGLIDLLPTAGGDLVAAPSGRIFKIERGSGGERVAYVRMFDGALRVRDHPTGGRDRVTGIEMLAGGEWTTRTRVTAGEIARLRGLTTVRVGDTIGTGRTSGDRNFAPPMLEALVVPRRAADGGRLRAALAQLAEQDPLIN